MRVTAKLAIALFTIALCTKLGAQQTAVIIDLTGQAAYLLEDGRVAFVSPIASGKEGRGTPIGSFRIVSKDLNHHSGSFGQFRAAEALSHQSSDRINPWGLPRSPTGTPMGGVLLTSSTDSRGMVTGSFGNVTNGCFKTTLPSLHRRRGPR